MSTCKRGITAFITKIIHYKFILALLSAAILSQGDCSRVKAAVSDSSAMSKELSPRRTVFAAPRRSSRPALIVTPPRPRLCDARDDLLFMRRIRPLSCQQNKSNLKAPRLFAVAGGLAAANYYAYQRFKNIWWQYPKTGFHLYRGWRQTQGWYDFGYDDSPWRHMDKFGHFYCSRLASLLLADAAQWVGFEHRQSRWIGALTSWLFYLQIELFDGQFEQWGFSLGDLTANTAGAFMPLLGERFPFLQKFKLKLSYHVSAEIEQEHFLIEDYAGMTFWLTSNPRDFMPAFFNNVWPAFLNIAVGYGISKKAHGDLHIYLGLDYDLRRCRTTSVMLNRVIAYLDYLHLPAPAMRTTPAMRFDALYY